MTSKTFKAKIYELAASIPCGQVVTYGQLAAMAGSPRAARVVGQIAHFGPTNLPWHRVVNSKGVLAASFVPGGRLGQAQLLTDEKVEVQDNFKVDLSVYRWHG